MNIAILKDWNTSYEEFAQAWDGIMRAFSIIGTKHEVNFFTKLGENEYYFDRWNMRVFSDHKRAYFVNKEFDAVVAWGSLDRPWHGYLDEFKGPKVLCFAGGPTEHPFLKFFDVVCVESKIYEEKFKAQGKNVIRAFGTNTDIFKHESRTPKIISAIYPASFCFHKNHELFARAMGGRGLCVGNDNEKNIVAAVLTKGTPTLRRVSSEALCDLYNMSHTTVVPCGPNGGAQRVVLESMACGVPVVVAADNDKCREFVEESGFGKIVEPIDVEIRDAVDELIQNPLPPSLGTDYIKSKWTEYHYADAILKAISIASTQSS